MNLSGSHVAIVTPMHTDGSLAMDALAGLVDRHLASGTAGIVVAGTTGEAVSLSDDEFQRLIVAVKDQVAGRCLVLAGAGAPSTARVIELAVRAADAGADALLCVTPYYLRTTQEGLIQHYCAVSEAVDLPLVLYNVPGRTGVDLLPETVGRLSHQTAVRGIKEAVAGAERTRELRDACGDRIQLLSGDDGSCLEAMLAGAAGVISVTANVVPAAMAALCALATSGRETEATALNDRLDPLHGLLMAEPNPIPVKWVLASLGWMPGGMRLPLVPATQALQGQLAENLDSISDLIEGSAVHRKR